MRVFGNIMRRADFKCAGPSKCIIAFFNTCLWHAFGAFLEVMSNLWFAMGESQGELPITELQAQ